MHLLPRVMQSHTTFFSSPHAAAEGTPMANGYGQPMMSPNPTYSFTPPRNQTQMSTPNHSGHHRPQPGHSSPQVLCPTIEGCFGRTVVPGAKASAVPMPSVVSFGMILKKELKEFQDACEAVGGPVAGALRDPAPSAQDHTQN
eukprot:2253211-Rhodomonas_salina.2